MANSVCKLFLVFMLMILVAAGLNASNQGISNLTLEDRGPIVGWQTDDNHVKVVLLGNDYDLKDGKWVQALEQQAVGILNMANNYFIRIWSIFKAVFLY